MVVLSSIGDNNLNCVSGGMPNPSCFKMSFDEIPEDKKNDRYFMHWWRIFNDQDIDKDREEELKCSQKGILG